ncbi:MAG: hypothetical protein HKN40_12985 [Winogradskyella sp.]|uniref:hypothetical protein n=1 Tax=Winogradskyella sp. TaxID=1883156 RepID=UPI0017A03BF0|nr:hypothetical protein [Winogradskyella sp.]
MKPTLFLLMFALCTTVAYTQVGIGTTNPDASAVLEIESDRQGMLTPRMSTEARSSIASPATGLLVFDTDLAAFYFYNGSAWEEMESKVAPNDKTAGWVALNDNDSSFTLPFVNSPDLNDYNNFVDIDLDFQNDPGDSTISSYAPTGTTASDFYNSTTHKLTPLVVGDAVVLRLAFDAIPNNGNGFIVIAIDIGDTSEIIIYEKTIPLLRGNGRLSKISETILLYQLGTFDANGAKLKIAYSRANQTTGTDCVVSKFGLVISKFTNF